MSADLPDLLHRWSPLTPLSSRIWECVECGTICRDAPTTALCRARVVAWSNQRAEDARAAALATVREAMLDLAPAGTWSRVEARLRGSTSGT